MRVSSPPFSITVVGAPSLPYTTSFPLDESPISEGGRWQHLGQAWTRVDTAGGRAFGTHHGTGYDDAYAHLLGFPADHRIEGTVVRDAFNFRANQEIELHLRWADAVDLARGYEILWHHENAYGYLVRWNGPLGDFNIGPPLGMPRAPVTGDVFAAGVVGTVITWQLNGADVGSADVADLGIWTAQSGSNPALAGAGSIWSDGNPGIGFYSDDASAHTDGANRAFCFSAITADRNA